MSSASKPGGQCLQMLSTCRTLTWSSHLLQEMTVPTYITNDVFLIGGKGDQHRERSQTTDQDDSASKTSSETDGPSMILLTGPNYSGKSVYQKQVALAVYMAHIGSFVSADTAIIGLTDKILTRITTRETVSKTQSAFMIDVQQIALALNQATCRSLVIIGRVRKGDGFMWWVRALFLPWRQAKPASVVQHSLRVIPGRVRS